MDPSDLAKEVSTQTEQTLLFLQHLESRFRDEAYVPRSGLLVPVCHS